MAETTRVNMRLVVGLPEYKAARARGDARRTLKAMNADEELRTMAFLYHYGLTYSQLARLLDLPQRSVTEKMKRWSRMVQGEPEPRGDGAPERSHPPRHPVPHSQHLEP